jgi:hypothetical protein
MKYISNHDGSKVLCREIGTYYPILERIIQTYGLN